jgi:putative ATP-binding cassette transporter
MNSKLCFTDKKIMNSEKIPGVSTKLWSRFLKITKIYWVSDQRWRLRAALMLLIALLLLQTTCSVLFNRETGEFISALADKDADRFWSSIWRYAIILSAAIPIYSFYYYLRDTIGLRWRKWLTDYFLTRYFSHRAYYQLDAASGIDNPDQRIAEDINAFTLQSLFFSMIVLGALIQMTAFAGVLWSISPGLVYFLVGYSIFTTWFTATVFGKPLIGLNFLQLQREADFRFGLVRVRENAEPIAFYDGEKREMSVLQRMFSVVFSNYQLVLRWQFKLNLFQHAHNFLTIVLPTIIIANDVLSGKLEVGLAVQAAGAFAYILHALTVIVDHFDGLSKFSAGVERLYAFSEALDKQSATSTSQSDKNERIITTSGEDLSFSQLTVRTPNGEQTLIKQLNLSISPDKGLMIIGASGSGKSSLLRVTAGLWSAGSGEIIRPHGEDLLFLPQKPYLALGDLRCQLTYPKTDQKISDEEILQCLDKVNLSSLTKRCGGLGAVMDWAKVLSVGEQQRLSFARALLIKPRYLLLDESTSALDALNETLLYSQLTSLGITPISVSHHKTLLQYHHEVLVMGVDGTWTLHAAESFNWV